MFEDIPYRSSLRLSTEVIANNLQKCSRWISSDLARFRGDYVAAQRFRPDASGGISRWKGPGHS